METGQMEETSEKGGARALRFALGKRWRRCPSLRCLGIRPQWVEYSANEQEAILASEEIYYPGPVYADLFRALGKKIYPENYYEFMGNKVRQTELFQLLEIPHPRTRIYIGRHRIERIEKDFDYPFVAKTPVGSSKGLGVFLIEEEAGLARYLSAHPLAYIQEYLPLERDLRVVVVFGRVVLAYWRIQRPGDFRNNVARGGRISFESLPPEALVLAEEVARRCRFDEVGLDLAPFGEDYCVLEANMVFGMEGFRQAGLDYFDLLARWDQEGCLLPL